MRTTNYLLIGSLLTLLFAAVGCGGDKKDKQVVRNLDDNSIKYIKNPGNYTLPVKTSWASFKTRALKESSYPADHGWAYHFKEYRKTFTNTEKEFFFGIFKFHSSTSGAPVEREPFLKYVYEGKVYKRIYNQEGEVLRDKSQQINFIKSILDGAVPGQSYAYGNFAQVWHTSKNSYIIDLNLPLVANPVYGASAWASDSSVEGQYYTEFYSYQTYSEPMEAL